ARNALLRELHALQAIRTLNWKPGPVPGELAGSLLADIDGLIPVSAAVDGDDSVLLDLERRIADDLLGTERAAGAAERDRALLAIGLSWTNGGETGRALGTWRP